MNKKMSIAAKVLCNVFSILFAIITVGGGIATANASAINSFLGETTQRVEQDPDAEPVLFYDSDYNDVLDLRDASEAIVEEVMSEGIVLLKNKDDVLPLKKGAKISFYSANAIDSVISGCGSSGAAQEAIDNAVSLKEGAENSGFEVNGELWQWYQNNISSYTQRPNSGGGSVRGNQSQTQSFRLNDASWAQLPSAKNNSADAAVVVLSRNAGENADMPMRADGTDYLQLGENERDILENLKSLKDNGVIGSIVVLMNSANQIQCDFVDAPEYGVDALIWCGTLATTGANAVGKILSGEVNPSGRLSDTFWYDHGENPVYYNIGDTSYGNSSVIDVTFNKGENKKYVAYQEGIYNGYRYTETRYEDAVMQAEDVGDYDYDKVVSYPFGYGLSYTSFEYSNFSVSKQSSHNGATYTVSVDVKNVGNLAGKEVVQIYLQKPYTDYDRANSVEKASVELVGYAKTPVLEVGSPAYTVTVQVDEKYFASYDSLNARTYVIGSTDSNDNYYLTAAKDAHDAVNNILAKKGYSPAQNTAMDASGNAGLVSDPIYIGFSDTKYSTNDVIRENVANFKERYPGQPVNFGVESITNQFDAADWRLYEGFSAQDQQQPYITRSNWEGTFGRVIKLNATSILSEDQHTEIIEKDDIEYPAYEVDNGLNLISLRNYDDGTLIEYDNDMWDDLLDQLSWSETVELLRVGLRLTGAVESINAPLTAQQNGATGPIQQYGYNSTGNEFEGFAKLYDSGVGEYPTIFPCNGIIASTFNTELIERLGEQIGEECAWCGYSGIYGMGVNIHRGSYCGRQFEYYSEDPFLTGISAAYEVKGVQSKGVFVILKHPVLNDQETNRHNVCAWANEQTIREIYLSPVELTVRYGDEMGMMGLMTGLNRVGAKWTSVQGFCNTVLRAEYGMKGYIISDFYKNYMNPANAMLNGNDLPDGETGNGSDSTADGVLRDLNQYEEGYGELAWAMREAAHRVLYTVVRSNQMNFFTPGMKIIKVVPGWQVALNAVTIVIDVLFALSVAFLVFDIVWKKVAERKNGRHSSDAAQEENKSTQ